MMAQVLSPRKMVATAMAVATMCGGIGDGAWAQSPPPTAAQGAASLGDTHDFHIKQHSLAEALKQFSSETKLELVYAEADVHGKETAGIDGNYSGLESLTRLLTGTGLAFKPSDRGVLITPVAHVPLVGASPALTAAWKKFAATMEQMRKETEASAMFQAEPWSRAKSYHALMEAQAMAYDFAVMPRLDYPRVQEATAWQLNNYGLGQTGPDCLYGNILLDGRQTYKITARPGDVRLTLLQVFNHVFGIPEGKLIGNYDLSQFTPNKDGAYEIVLSATKHDGNWIRLDPSSSDNWIMTRRWIADWNNDPGELNIEMTSTPANGYYDYDEFSEDAIAKRIESAAYVAKYLVESWNLGLYKMYLNASGGETNHMVSLPGASTSQFGSPTSNYALGVFDLKPDEALIVELDDVPTDAAYWSFQLGDVWSRSLDFMNRQTSINMAEAVLDADGKFRAVISAKDPGVANWLDTADHPGGTIVFRNYRSKTAPVPVVRKVAFADLWKYLPKDTRRVTADERRQHIAHRRQGLMKTYGGVF